MKPNQKKLLIASTILVIAAIFIAGAFIYKTREAARLEALAKADLALFVRPHAPQLGNPEAKVYIAEFLDPECESCRAAYPLVKSVLKEYPTQVKLVVRYVPLHGNSEFAIKVLEAARNQGKYWEALDIIFNNQPEWGSHHNPRPELILTYMPQIFVDVDRLKQDMNDSRITAIIRQDVEDARKLGVRGTPNFYVNGKIVGLRELEKAVAEEVKKQYD